MSGDFRGDENTARWFQEMTVGCQGAESRSFKNFRDAFSENIILLVCPARYHALGIKILGIGYQRT